jgi:DHA2 family multidrug resistance protein
LLQGLGTPFFMIGLMTLGLVSVPPRETASAAGLMAFVRTLGTALATSIATTVWADGAEEARAQLSGIINGGGAFLDKLSQSGFSHEQARGVLEQLVEKQGAAISASHLFVAVGLLCILVAQLAWIIPKPKGGPAVVAAH